MCYLIDLLGDNDRLSIIEFCDWSQKLNSLLKMNKKNKSKVNDIISGINAGGGTEIPNAVLKGLNTIKKKKYKN